VPGGLYDRAWEIKSNNNFPGVSSVDSLARREKRQGWERRRKRKSFVIAG
jgi:hypothetical protein